MEQRLSLITLGVSDLAQSRRFYEDGLGWKPSSVSVDDVVFFQAGGIVLSLYPRHLLAQDAHLSSTEPTNPATVTGGTAPKAVEASIRPSIEATATPSPTADALTQVLERPAGPVLPNAFGGIALAYNTRTREDVDAVLETARQAGATILKPAQEAFWGGYSGYFADLDGYPWEVAWNPGFPLNADGMIQLPQ